MNYSSRIALLLCIVAATGFEALGCSCFLLPLDDSFKDADAVFRGKAVRPFQYDSERFLHWKIEVDRVWKGSVSVETELISHRPDDVPTLSYCMPDFPVGETFLFFVEKDKDRGYKTIPCSWTSSISNWNPLLKKHPEDKAFWQRQGKGLKPENNKLFTGPSPNPSAD